MKCLISRDSFFASEVDIFEAVYRWIQVNTEVSEEGQSDVLSAVRLPRMSTKELLTVVRPTGLISPDMILDAIEVQTIYNNSKISHRGLLRKYNSSIPCVVVLRLVMDCKESSYGVRKILLNCDFMSTRQGAYSVHNL